MGYVYADVKIGDPKHRQVVERKMLVDTGATYTCIPPEMARELGLRAIGQTQVTIADKRKVKAKVSMAYMEIEGRGELIRVNIFDVAEPVIGVFTLEALGLGVEPATGKLRLTRQFITRA